MASITHSKSDCQLSALRQLENDLVDVIKHEIDVVLTKAWSLDIVGQQVRSLAQASQYTCRVKAEKFVAVIRARLKTDPQTFDMFLSILQSFPSLGHLAVCLNEKVCSEHRSNLGGFSDSPPMTSTPKHGTIPPSSVASGVDNNSPSEYCTRTPPRARGKKKKDRGSETHKTPQGTVLGQGMPKLALNETDNEESGYQDENSLAVDASPQLSDSELIGGDLATNEIAHNGSRVSFEPPVEAELDYKPFSNSTHIEYEQQSRQSENELPPRDASGIVSQELRHNAATQQQVVSGSGMQTTAEGWAAKANYFINQGVARVSDMSNEIEELKKKIASLKQQIDTNKDESSKVE